METLLAPGQEEDTSEIYEIAAGDIVTIGLYTADSGQEIPPGAVISIFAITPGNPTCFATLGGHDIDKRVKQLAGPCSIEVYRPDVSRYSADVGVYVDDGT